MKFSELKREMISFNKKHEITRKVCTKYKDDGTIILMRGKVVLSNKVLNREYPEDERTYVFTNYNKALTSSDIGYSIFGICEKDADFMRLEGYADCDVESAEIIEVVE